MPPSNLSVPLTSIGKRSRSNSSSSSSSSAASSTGESIFSQFTCSESADSLSSCSSPDASADTSPYSDNERPCKTLRTERSTSTDVALEGLKKKCTLEGRSEGRLPLTDESERPDGGQGKSVFVDCLVDAALNVLDNIWEAPLDRSIAFVCSGPPSRTSSGCEGIVRSSVCAIGRAMTGGGIPADLFIRETLRRSRTSCSTLQVALLLCKRAGGEVIRRRAEHGGRVLSEEERSKLPRAASTFTSLASQSCASDVILCSRRIFLASIMVASKFLQDRTFSNRAWSKISGLSVRELGDVERRLLTALDFDLNVRDQDWSNWTNYLKSDWKPSTASTSVVAPQPSLQSLSRRSLERTASLAEEEALVADVTLPSGDEKAFFFSSPVGPPDLEQEAKESTPIEAQDQRTPRMRTSVKGTTVRGRQDGSASDLLSTALHNHALTGSASGMPLPFPLRKGLAVRSISSF